MQKKRCRLIACPAERGHIHFIRSAVKLTVFILFLTHAAGMAQNVSLTGSRLSLRQVFATIEKQTGYVVFLNEQMLNNTKPVSLSVSRMPLRELLDMVLKDQPLAYAIQDKTIFLSLKPASSPGPSSPVTTSGRRPIRIRVAGPGGRALAGASVTVENSKLSGVTDGGGMLILDLNEGDNIIISFVGLEKRAINISKAIFDNGEITVMLNTSANKLNEVEVMVNTGYQKILPVQSTGAVSQISTKQYESQINTSFLSGLQGKIPGLLINNDIQFNGNSLFQIRGLSTMSANAQPLIVIDGYPTALSLNDINPNEIKTVTVLKDAAAAAIYGVKASNGVIVVERKDAVKGKPDVVFRTTFAFKPRENYSNYRWAPDDTYLRFIRYQYQDGATVSPGTYSAARSAVPLGLDLIYEKAAGYISQQQLESGFKKLTTYNNTKDYEKLFLRTALSQTYNFDVSGGNDLATYYITAAYTGDKNNMVRNSDYKLQLSSRLNMSFSKRFSLQLIDDYTESRATAVPVPSVNSIYPSEHFRDANGNPLPVTTGSGTNSWYNQTLIRSGLPDALAYPLNDINEINDKTHITDNRIDALFIYDLGKGFNVNFGGVYETSHTDERYYASANSSLVRENIDYYAQPVTGGTGYNFIFPKGGYLRQNGSDLVNYTARAQLNYDKHFGADHYFNGLLGGEINKAVTQSALTTTLGYNDETLIVQPVDYVSLSKPGGNHAIASPGIYLTNFPSLFAQGYTDNRFVSAYVTGLYTYKSRYSLTASARIDQSNLFGTDPKYRYKPLWHVAGGWLIHQEKFMENVNWVHNLKLRVSEGFNGNVAKNSIPQIIARSVVNTTTNNPNTLMLSSPANGGLRWEKTNNLNIGLDYSIFKGIKGSLDYYDKKSTDLLSQISAADVDATRGTSASSTLVSGGLVMINQGSIINRGMELNLQADWITRPRFNWYTGFELSRNTNKVMNGYLPYSAVSPSYSWVYGNTKFVPGYSSGVMFSYRFAGLDNTGLPQIYDKDGKIVTQPGGAGHPDGGRNWVTYSGTTIPTYSAGMSNRVDIGNFYVYCMMNFFGGNKVRLPVITPVGARPIDGAQHFWQKPGDEKTTNVMNFAATTITNQQNYAYQYGDIFVMNGAYATLSSLTASYNFAKERFFRLKHIRLFELRLQADNVYTVGFNKYNYSLATGNFMKRYLTPTYTVALYTEF